MIDATTSTDDINKEKVNKLNSSQNIKDLNFFTKDFLYFKNDILKEIRDIHLKFDNQKKYNFDLKNLISSQETKFIKFNNQLENLSNIMNDKNAEIEYYKDKFNVLFDFKTKAESMLGTHDYKIKINTAELKDAMNKYDRIISNYLSYSGNFGKDNKFKDFNELMNYILNQIKIFSLYKEKNSVDLKTYKIKLDTMINSLNLQISGIIDNANTFTTSNIQDLDKKCSNQIKEFNDKLLKIRVDDMELIKNFQKEKDQIFNEWENIKNMKKELVELVETSIKKINISNSQMKKTLDNYEKQFNEVKNDIVSINEIYNDMKNEREKEKEKENMDYIEYIKNIGDISNNLEDKQYFKINSKSDIFKIPTIMSEKSNGKKRIQSAKSVLQNYIEGNSFYEELLEKNSKRCKKHENSEPSANFIMRKYYDEGLNNIKNQNIFKTIENIMTKNIFSSEKNKLNKTVNTTPKSSVNLKKIHQKLEKYDLNIRNINKTKQTIDKKRKNSGKKKILLREENNENTWNITNKKIKIKSNEIEKRVMEQEKFAENFIDYKRITNMKQLSSLNFLHDDIKNKKFPKIENKKDDEASIKIGKNIRKKIKNKVDKIIFKEYNVVSGFKIQNNNHKAIKIKNRINSSKDIKRYNNESENDISLYNNNNEYISEHNKKLDEKLKTRRKSYEFNKKSNVKLKHEKK